MATPSWGHQVTDGGSGTPPAIIDATYAERFNDVIVGRPESQAWLSVQFFVLYWGPNGLPYVGMKQRIDADFKLADGTEIKLSNWSLLQVTPTQLRQLADALEAEPTKP